MGNKTHYEENGNYACNPVPFPNPKKMFLLPKNVTCVNCLKIIIKEWKEQVDSYVGHPLKNAKKQLKIVEKQLEKALSPEAKEKRKPLGRSPSRTTPRKPIVAEEKEDD